MVRIQAAALLWAWAQISSGGNSGASAASDTRALLTLQCKHQHDASRTGLAHKLMPAIHPPSGKWDSAKSECTRVHTHTAPGSKKRGFGALLSYTEPRHIVGPHKYPEFSLSGMLPMSAIMPATRTVVYTKVYTQATLRLRTRWLDALYSNGTSTILS